MDKVLPERVETGVKAPTVLLPPSVMSAERRTMEGSAILILTRRHVSMFLGQTIHTCDSNGLPFSGNGSLFQQGWMLANPLRAACCCCCCRGGSSDGSGGGRVGRRSVPIATRRTLGMGSFDVRQSPVLMTYSYSLRFFFLRFLHCLNAIRLAFPSPRAVWWIVVLSPGYPTLARDPPTLCVGELSCVVL